MATESYVQVAPDAEGKKIDAVIVTQDDGTELYRQAIVVGDPTLPGNFANVNQVGLEVDAPSVNDLLMQILIELKILNLQIQATQNFKDDLDKLRNEF